MDISELMRSVHISLEMIGGLCYLYIVREEGERDLYRRPAEASGAQSGQASV